MNKLKIRSSLAIILLFLVDFVSFLADYAPIPVLKIIVYVIAVMLICSIWKLLPKNKLSKNSIWIWIGIYLIMIFNRISVDFLIPGTGFFLYKSPSTIFLFFIIL